MTNKCPKYLPSLGRLLNFAAQGSSSLSGRKLDPHGMSLAHWVILSALWRQDGLTVGELVQYYRSKDVVLTRTLDRMVERGFVQRELDPSDRRVIRIRLTRKGKDLSHLLAFYQEINDLLLKGFSTQERDTLYSLLERVIVNAGEALED